MSGFAPKIVGFLCNWCSYAGADKAGSAHSEYPPGVTLVRVMCSGRVEPEFVLEAFRNGADGVFIMGCHPGDCHYRDGNLKALGRHELLAVILEQMGIESERCAIHFVSAGEGERFVELVKAMEQTIARLGPLDL